jgi:hypothetical protein
MKRFPCIAAVVLIGLFSLSGFCQEPVSSDLAARVAQHYCDSAFGRCSIVRVDTYFDLLERPYYYAVTLALDEDAKIELSEILGEIKRIYLEKEKLMEEGDDARDLVRKKEIEMYFDEHYARVLVSTTRDRTPVFSIKRGLPVHIVKLYDTRQAVGIGAHEEPALSKTYVTGTYSFSGELTSGTTKVLVDYFTLRVTSKGEAVKSYESGLLIEHPKSPDPRTEVIRESKKSEKRKRIEGRWRFFDQLEEEHARLPEKQSKAGQNEIPSHSAIDYTQWELGLSSECYAAAGTSVLGYWDDHTLSGDGPWEGMVVGGNASCSSCMYNLAQDLTAGYSCSGEHTICYWTDCHQDMMNYVSDGLRGSSFTYDEDCLSVWWGWDYKDEIDAGKPVHYTVWGHSYWSNHSVVGIGWREQDSPETYWVRCYNNNSHGVDEIDFDAGTEHGQVVADPGGYTAVSLSELVVVPGDMSNEIRWQTETEIANAGFYVYRAQSIDGSYAKVNETLIAGGQYSYQLVDNDVINGEQYFYVLEDLDLGGHATRYVSFPVTPLNPDLDGSQTLEQADLQLMARAMFACVQDSEYHPAADINSDSKVDDRDLFAYLDSYDLQYGILPGRKIVFGDYEDLRQDINQDGVLDRSDLLAIVESYMKTSTEPEYQTSSDLDASGQVDRVDMELFVAAYIRLNPPQPCQAPVPNGPFSPQLR